MVKEKKERERKTAEETGEDKRALDKERRKEVRDKARGTGRYAPRNILEYLRNLVAGY